ncbi:MAG: Gfo/Idh/MocA family oxidoreductase [Flavobacteriales bacterium]|nr:Gfo/Idh/MocA family oxidoreductase [Flavobacteriales bacterium]MCB9448238.1 Gfo/Idh/MocA family oxidoreductase [Flavobacteriales bacterium]
MKIGVLGAGHLGTIHIRLLREIPGYELTGFYDPDPAKRKEAETNFGIPSFESVDALMDAVDAVDIVTPTLSHFECARKALAAGKHIFIEKPVTNTPEEAETLVKMVRESGLTAQVGHVERFNPAFQAVRHICSRPLFIEAHRLAEFNPRGTDVSVVLDLMIHDIDVILSVVRSPVKDIHASGVAVVSDTPDITNARIEFENGCVANLTASRISLKNMRKCRFFQGQAYVAVDFLEKKAEVTRIKEAVEPIDPMSLILDLGEKGKKEIYFEHPDIPASNAIKEELTCFLEAIRTGSQPPVTIEDGYHALRIAWQINEKVRISPL